jgi:hypothetical protein
MVLLTRSPPACVSKDQIIFAGQDPKDKLDISGNRIKQLITAMNMFCYIRINILRIISLGIVRSRTQATEFFPHLLWIFRFTIPAARPMLMPRLKRECKMLANLENTTSPLIIWHVLILYCYEYAVKNISLKICPPI